MSVTADPIHQIECEALARRIRREERIRRIMRVYGYARWQAEEVVASAQRIVADMEEEELAEERREAQDTGGEWLGVAAILVGLLGLWALVRWML